MKTCTYMHAKLQKEECMKKKIGSDFLTEEIREIAEGELDKDGRLNARDLKGFLLRKSPGSQLFPPSTLLYRGEAVKFDVQAFSL